MLMFTNIIDKSFKIEFVTFIRPVGGATLSRISEAQQKIHWLKVKQKFLLILVLQIYISRHIMSLSITTVHFTLTTQKYIFDYFDISHACPIKVNVKVTVSIYDKWEIALCKF